MKRLILSGLLAATLICGAADAFALSFSVDTPTQYTFDNSTPNAQKNAKADKQTTTDVQGFKLLVAGAHHIGVGYENYDVKGDGKSNGSGFGYDLKLQFYDVVLDLPARGVNFGLGAGMGRANADILRIPGGPIVQGAGASQYFASVGIALGEHFDIHAAYHVVTIGDMKLTNIQGGSDSLKMSGHTVMAGIRLAW